MQNIQSSKFNLTSSAPLVSLTPIAAEGLPVCLMLVWHHSPDGQKWGGAMPPLLGKWVDSSLILCTSPSLVKTRIPTTHTPRCRRYTRNGLELYADVHRLHLHIHLSYGVPALQRANSGASWLQVLKQNLSSSNVAATDAAARVCKESDSIFFEAAGIVLSCGIHTMDTGFILPCMYLQWLSSGIFPNNAKLQRPIVSKRISDGTNPIILVYSIMELQLLKHTSLAILTVIFGLPWLLAVKASGLQMLQTCL